MPIGTADPFRLIVMELTASAFFTITVHRAAPTRSRKLPKTERDDEIRKATVCFKTPLIKDASVGKHKQMDLDQTHENNVNAVQIEPSSIK